MDGSCDCNDRFKPDCNTGTHAAAEQSHCADDNSAAPPPRPLAFCDLALGHDEPAGFAIWSSNYSIFLGRRCLWLANLFVAETYRRKEIIGTPAPR
jgi:hypothetical protein